MAPTLLLADDSLTIQRVVELTFADEDVRVVAVSDGDQAIARVDEQPPDIVLADVGMPGKNGYEVASYIKHSPRLAHIPVLLLTGAFEPIDQRLAADAGCDGVLAKPFEPQFVIGRVRQLLGMSAAKSEAEETRVPIVRQVAALPEVHSAEGASAIGATSSFEEIDRTFADATGRESDQQTIDIDAALVDAPPDSSTDIHPPMESLVDSEPSGSAPHSHAAHAESLAHAFTADDGASKMPVLPTLADAFAALLAAEQSASTPSEPGAWTPPARYAVTDEVVERVVERVLERLSDRLLRDALADIVSRVAERMVRDEIDRIKASVK